MTSKLSSISNGNQEEKRIDVSVPGFLMMRQNIGVFYNIFFPHLRQRNFILWPKTMYVTISNIDMLKNLYLYHFCRFNYSMSMKGFRYLYG